MSHTISLGESAEMGLCCAVVGLAAGAAIAATALGHGYAWFMLAAPVAAYLAGSLLWRLLVVRAAVFSWQRCASDAALVVVVGF